MSEVEVFTVDRVRLDNDYTSQVESVVLLSDYDALAAQRDEGVAREAELRDQLGRQMIRLDFTNADGSHDSRMLTHEEMRQRYADLVLALHQQPSEALQQRLAEAEKDAGRFRFLVECPIRTVVALSRMADRNDNFDLASECDRFMPSPGCADGEKS